MPTDVMDRFVGQSYINLETFRRTGAGVRTPVWFAAEEGMIYVRTLRQSGKVKRVSRDSRVRVVPSDARGEPLDEWADGEAHLVEDRETASHANRLFRRKYGLAKVGFDLVQRLRGGRWATIAIRVTGPD